jgi:Ca2+:H+ antiporter
LIVAILALVKKETLIVKTSLIGGILSNLLLALGMCFLFGGLRRERQYFNLTVVQTGSSLLALAAFSLIIPTTFQMWTQASDGGQLANTSRSSPLSRASAILLLLIYGWYDH